MDQWTTEERKNIPPRYGCSILIQNAGIEQLKDPSWPLDAYIVEYVINDEFIMDLCRGSKTKIFDLYYDKFGPNSLKNIRWGYGKVNPKLWGYKTSETKKNKK